MMAAAVAHETSLPRHGIKAPTFHNNRLRFKTINVANNGFKLLKDNIATFLQHIAFHRIKGSLKANLEF